MQRFAQPFDAECDAMFDPALRTFDADRGAAQARIAAHGKFSNGFSDQCGVVGVQKNMPRFIGFGDDIDRTRNLFVQTDLRRWSRHR